MKVVLVGDTQVGKTCILGRLTTGTFRASSPATVGAAFQNHVMTTSKGVVTMQIWDTAGQEKYRALAPMYYRSAQVAILFFDLTNLESFRSLDQWANELEEKTTGELRLFLVGNKCDLEAERKVKREEAEEFGFQHGAIEYVETSAKTGAGVVELFTKVAETSDTVSGQENENQNPKVVDTRTQSAGKKPGCC
ncbi:small GTP-binding protein [Tritrichomonas foetus]|uniref:Small GTP-binding protein n=1 Tax=Tritrichomonas foetus TaxID=1144522 RepID=A0A1J4JJD2_9EUKA|nr:small GTP-binding protein [Tritrichomonas foetus]|eukprot:OHS97348.1 small GTP-binding protein [Tritrichomonas foetus]